MRSSCVQWWPDFVISHLHYQKGPAQSCVGWNTDVLHRMQQNMLQSYKVTLSSQLAPFLKREGFRALLIGENAHQPSKCRKVSLIFAKPFDGSEGLLWSKAQWHKAILSNQEMYRKMQKLHDKESNTSPCANEAIFLVFCILDVWKVKSMKVIERFRSKLWQLVTR